MFRKKRKSEEYIKFEEWANNYSKNLEANKNKEEEYKTETKTYGSSRRNTVFRKFSNNKDVKEIFPRNNEKDNTTMDSKSHEGKVNPRGSISGNPLMGREGDPINPDLRRRLIEKKKADRKNKDSITKSEKAYQKSLSKDLDRKRKINSLKSSLKDKDSFRKAIITSEILGPPRAKKPL